MLKKLAVKTKFNLSSSLRHGTVAAATLLLVGWLFGNENMMLAFPVALTSVVMGKLNFRVKILHKYISIIIIDIMIILIAHISGLNIYLGIPINFIAIFLIAYIVISPYEFTVYRPFIMLYVFAQFRPVSTEHLGYRIISVVIGITFMAVASMIRRDNEKTLLGSSLKKTFSFLSSYAGAHAEGENDEEYIGRCTRILTQLTNRVYLTRHRHYLTTVLGRLQFQIMVLVENLTFTLEDIDYFTREQWLEFKNIFDKFIEYGDRKITYDQLNNVIDGCEVLKNHYEESLMSNVYGIAEALHNLEMMGKKEINKVYGKWQRSSLDMPSVLFKEYFNINTIRFKFAMRISITLTAAIFLGKILGFYKIIWTVVTILSIMYPYYEDTVSRVKDRVVGNLFAITFTGLVINAVDLRSFTIVMMITSLYLIYGFREYYKISLFAAITSLCLASLTQDVNILIIYRISYVIIGALIVYIANRFIFPYHIKDGIADITKKIVRYNIKLIDDVNHYNNGSLEEHEIRDLVIHCILLGEKLHVRNSQYGDKNIEEFIRHNNKFVISMAMQVL